MSKHTARHFWNKVNMDAEGDACWEWQSTRNEKNYGRFWFEGQRMMAHRVAYILTHEDFDRSLDVLHSCDNPPCCRPDHLFEGTNDDNVKDKVQKNRQAATVTPDQVLEIRRLYREEAMLQKDIAVMFGIQVPAVSRIISGIRWGHLTQPADK